MPENIFDQQDSLTTSITGLTCKPLAILSETISPQEMSMVRGGTDLGQDPPIPEGTVCFPEGPYVPEPTALPEPEPSLWEEITETAEDVWEEITETAEEVWDEATEFVEDVWDWLTDDEEEEEEEKIDEEETEEDTEVYDP